MIHQARTDVKTSLQTCTSTHCIAFFPNIWYNRPAFEIDDYGLILPRSAKDRLEDAHEIAFVRAAGHGKGSGAV
jgi:hypothetical protein